MGKLSDIKPPDFRLSLNTLLNKCLRDGFVLPQVRIFMGDNGALAVMEAKEDSERWIIKHKLQNGFDLPIHIIVCDAEGRVKTTVLEPPTAN